MKATQLQLILLALVISGLGFVCQAQEPTSAKTKPTDKPATYSELVQRVKGGDLNVDFVALRDAYALWLCVEEKTDAPNRDAMVEAFEKKDYGKAANLIESVLDYEFVNRGLHRAAEDAYQQLNDQTKADFHKTIAHKLYHAMMNSGTGKTEDTAYRVLSVREEYMIMNELGYDVHGQALLGSNNKHFDLLMGKDSRTGKEVKVYFDITSFFWRLRKD